MEYIANVKIRKPVIVVNANARYIRRTVAISSEPIQQVQSVRTNLRPRISGKETKSAVELLLNVRLEPMVVAAAPVRSIARILGKVRDRQPALRRIRNTWRRNR